MKNEDIHKMKDEELTVEAERLRRELYELKCQAVTEKLENPRKLRNMRRDIARLLTEQRTREIAATPTATPTPATA